MLGWTKQFDIFCFLDNADYSIQPHQYDCLLAAGALESISGNHLNLLDEFLDNNPGWKFGHLSYVLKNSIHGFRNHKPDRIGFPSLFFFTPKHLVQIEGNAVTIHSEDSQVIYE